MFFGLLHAILIFCYMPSPHFPSVCEARFSELCEIYLITKKLCSPAVNVICIPEDLQTSFTWHSQQWGKRIKWVCGHITRPPAESYEKARPILIRKNIKSLHESHYSGLLRTTSCNYKPKVWIFSVLFLDFNIAAWNKSWISLGCSKCVYIKETFFPKNLAGD